jgi:putative flippase GtrA
VTGAIAYSWPVTESGAESEAPGPDVALARPARLANLLRGAFRREEVRYLVVAGTVAVAYLGILAALLAAGFQYMIAILVSQVVIFSVAFPVYRRVIFRSTGRWRPDLARFLGVWSGGFVAGIVATPALVELAGTPPLLAQVIAVAAVAVLTFLGHKFVSFRR